jgi:hypothetical protein
LSVNVAVTVLGAFRVRVQVVPVPAQSPLHPAKEEPVAGAAVKVMVVPSLKSGAQIEPQLTPDGELVTSPVPVPVLIIVKRRLSSVNVAVTDLSVFMVTAQVVAVPEHPPLPLQPANVEPATGLAVKVTMVPLSKLAVHVVPHEIPAGLLDTVPKPLPAVVTVRSCCNAVNAAVTALSAFIVTVHVPVPEHPGPLQPVKLNPGAGTAVSTTTVPC